MNNSTVIVFYGVRCNQRLAKKFLEGTHQVVQPEAPNIEVRLSNELTTPTQH